MVSEEVMVVLMAVLKVELVLGTRTYGLLEQDDLVSEGLQVEVV